ncbi:MAG: hypothetical protein IT429_17230 [Gemmataceae bacterium]|nr:hypothetical protein [Gemmataceae bacterium]
MVPARPRFAPGRAPARSRQPAPFVPQTPAPAPTPPAQALNLPAAAPAPPLAAAPAPPPAAAPAPPPAVARGKIDDPALAWSASARLTLPPPEQLGIAAAPPVAAGAPPASVDWNTTHAQLRTLGAVGIQLARLPAGEYRFGFLLPTDRADVTRHVEAVGATEAEAVRLALDRARRPQ